MKTFRRVAVSVIVGILFLSLANVESGWAEEELPDETQMPGVLEGTGTHFELTGSEYLNIVLDSSEPIRLFLESVPEMITMHLESASGASSTQITLSGFIPQTEYHKYEDDYHNHVAFTTDVSGSYTFTQDLSAPHLLFIQPRPSTIFLSDAGWSPPVGTWDPATKIATLTQDLTGTVQIDSDNITIDGNRHTITGTNTGNGVYLPTRTGVTIKNLTVKNFSNGIYFYSCNSNNLTGNTCENNSYGIYLSSSSHNNFGGNTASHNRDGIRLYSANNNNLTGNTASHNRYNGILLTSSANNNLTGNTMSNNTYNFNVAGSSLSHFTQTIDTTNTVDAKPIYYLVGASGVVIDASTNASYVGVVNSINVTVKGLTVTKCAQGVLFAYTSDSSIENVNASNNQYGIYLYSSSNNHITGNTCMSNSYGIYIYSSSHNNFEGNTISDNTEGISLSYAGDNNLTGNTMSNNTYNFNVAGSSLSNYVQTIDTSNTVDGKPVYYLVGASGVVIDASTNAGYVAVVNSINVTVKDLTLTKCAQGVLFVNTTNSTIENVTTSNNQYGIYLYSSSNNHITGNTTSDNKNGVYLFSSNNNYLTGNTSMDNYYGIYLSSSNNNVLTGNTASDNTEGISLSNSGNNNLTNNTVSDSKYGINLRSSSNNQLMDNNLSNNKCDVCQDGKVNQPPAANAGGPYVGDEGSPITLNASGSSDPDGDALRYRWDFNNDEKWDSEWSSNPTVSHTWDDDYSGVVRLAVTDGLLTSTNTAQVTVKNVPPKVEAGSDKTAECGIDEVAFSGSFTDPGRLDTHVIKWDFGDGSTATGALTPTHKYSNTGKYTVTLTVTDDNGGEGRDTLLVTVVDTIPPKVVAGKDVIAEQEGYEGTKVTLSAKVSDTCDPNPTVTWSHGPTDVFPLGVTVVKVTATDKSGNNASDEVVVSIYGARTVKSTTIAKLESAKAGDKLIDREIDEIIKRVNNSLDEELWVIDDSHINPKHGVKVFHKVFQEEEAAVLHMQTRIMIFEKEIPGLEKIIAMKKKKGNDTSGEEAKLAAIKTALPVFKEVVDDLVKADRILAIVAIGDAKNTEVQNPRFQKIVEREIQEAERELDKANKEGERGSPAKAIMNFEKAWLHAQLAIEFASKPR